MCLRCPYHVYKRAYVTRIEFGDGLTVKLKGADVKREGHVCAVGQGDGVRRGSKVELIEFWTFLQVPYPDCCPLKLEQMLALQEDAQ